MSLIADGGRSRTGSSATTTATAGTTPPASPPPAAVKDARKHASSTPSGATAFESSAKPADTGSPLASILGRLAAGAVTTLFSPAAPRAASKLAGKGDATSGTRRSTASGATPPAATTAATPASPSTTQNDLRAGGHEGTRDRQIEQLRQDLSNLETVDVLSKVVEAGVPLLGLLARPLVEHFAGKVDEQIVKKRETLEHSEVLNFMANTLHALGASQGVVNALDGATKIEVVPDSTLESDAAYDPASKSIKVSESVIEDTQRTMETLEAQGIVTEAGDIAKPAALDQSKAADEVIKAASLIAVHEQTHADQDAHGIVEATVGELRQMYLKGISFAAHLPSDDRQDMLSYIGAKVEKTRIRMEEYAAYNRQERAQFELGASTRTRLTIDARGGNLPVDQAVDNIYAFQLGQPLPFGPTAGAAPTAGTAGGAQAPAAAAAASPDGGRIPGDDVPGGRIPGGRIPGELLLGMLLNGGRIPGDEISGGRIPGGRIPGGRIPGGRIPGGRIPGGRIPGGRIPGLIIRDYMPPTRVP